MINAIRRELPEHVDDYGRVAPFAGAFVTRPNTRRHAPPVKTGRPGDSKLVGNISGTCSSLRSTTDNQHPANVR